MEGIDRPPARSSSAVRQRNGMGPQGCYHATGKNPTTKNNLTNDQTKNQTNDRQCAAKSRWSAVPAFAMESRKGAVCLCTNFSSAQAFVYGERMCWSARGVRAAEQVHGMRGAFAQTLV